MTRRPLNQAQRGALHSAIAREKCGLAKLAKAKASPRTVPTLPRLRCLEGEEPETKQGGRTKESCRG